MKIKKLFKFVKEDVTIINNHKINSLKINSKEVKDNDVFFVVNGSNNYVKEAIINGAKTIIFDGELIKEFHHINYIKVKSIKPFMALCAKYYYKNISKKVKVIAITGTNGKTTISTLLADFLSYLGEEVLLIGTNGIYVFDQHFHTANTTPNILEIYDAMYYSYKKGIRYVVLEASSIGIREARLLYLDIDIVVFSNLTHDHLDYHKNITDYKFSKGLIMWGLEDNKNKCLILNSDDENYSFYSSLAKCKIITYSINKESDFVAKEVNKSFHQSNFNVCVNNNTYCLKTSLVGGFNIYNILAVMATSSFLKKSLIDFVDFLKIYIPVNGRMNKIFYKNKTIIIDFAHTPSSVNNVLSNIKQFTNNQLCVVIGCGGNRDIEKRSKIGSIATEYGDRVIFTMDNPRNEDIHKIMLDIVKDIKKDNYEIIYNREEAIHKALEFTNKDEVILILGKGNEKSQIINDIKHPFSDKKVVYNWIKDQEKS